MPLLPRVSNSEENSDTLGDRTPLPAADYLAHIVKTEFKPIKIKPGESVSAGNRLNIQFTVLEGDHKGRVFFTGLNLDHKNAQAAEISNKEANSISEALGLADVEDSDEWLQIPMCVTLTVNPGNASWPPSNDVRGYAPADAYEAPEDSGVSGVVTSPEDAFPDEDFPEAAGELVKKPEFTPPT
jgi:hypothetical protein